MYTQNMTVRDSLEKCIEGWQEVADSEYPQYKGPILNQFFNLCPCCQYSLSQQTGGEIVFCSHCPIPHWNQRTPCTSSGSEYGLWLCAAGEDEHKDAALGMVAMAKAALAALNLEEPCQS